MLAYKSLYCLLCRKWKTLLHHGEILKKWNFWQNKEEDCNPPKIWINYFLHLHMSQFLCILLISASKRRTINVFWIRALKNSKNLLLLCKENLPMNCWKFQLILAYYIFRYSKHEITKFHARYDFRLREKQWYFDIH